MEKGKGKWVRILYIMPVRMKLKKEARQVNQKFFEFKKREYRDGQHAQKAKEGWLGHDG